MPVEKMVGTVVYAGSIAPALCAHARQVLDDGPTHRAPKSRLLDELEDHMTTTAAEQTLPGLLSLEDPR